MASETGPLYVVHLLGFAGFFWLGLYALAHGDGRRISAVTGLAALCTACFFFAGGLLIAAHGAAWSATINRATWWADVLPIALWLHLSLLLNPHTVSARRRHAVLWADYGVAALLIVAGMTTNAINDYGHQPVMAGPAYALYLAYVALCTVSAVVNFASVRPPHRPARGPLQPPGQETMANGTDAHVRPSGRNPSVVSAEAAGTGAALLIAGAICFVFGAGYLALKMLLHSPWYELPAYILLLAGLGAVGTTVTVHGALFLGKDLRRDALYSVAGLAVLLALYLAAVITLIGFDDVRHGLFVLLLVALITTVHTLFDAARDGLDAAFFPPALREERAAARAYATALAVPPVGTHPDLTTVKAFDDAVRRALTNLSDPTKLSTSPLLNLIAVERSVAEQHLEDNRLNRAAVLKEMLLDLLNGLRPSDGSGRVTSDAWRYYNCLYYPYGRGISRRRAPTVLRQVAERRAREGKPRGEMEQVLEWLLAVDVDTFYKWQRRGSDTIAATLREREVAAGRAVPQPVQADKNDASAPAPYSFVQ